MANDKEWTIADAQRERYQRPLREKIEGLIIELEALRTDAVNRLGDAGHADGIWLDGCCDGYSHGINRLRTILDSEN